MKMEIKTGSGGATALLSGEIDHHNAKELRSQLDKFIISVQPALLVMDFKNITFMDSSGIGLIMEVRNTQPYIRRVLRLSGIERIVKIT